MNFVFLLRFAGTDLSVEDSNYMVSTTRVLAPSGWQAKSAQSLKTFTESAASDGQFMTNVYTGGSVSPVCDVHPCSIGQGCRFEGNSRFCHPCSFNEYSVGAPRGVAVVHLNRAHARGTRESGIMGGARPRG